MTLLASLREPRRHVIGVRRPLVILQMAAGAGRGVQCVIVVDVAVAAQARWHRMGSAQRESRARMIEGRIQPRRGVVALLAGLREVRRNVVGIRRPLKIFQMARDAGGVRNVVVVVDVAVRTLPRRHRVHARQRER